MTSPARSNGPNDRADGFTLLELLVTISIMAAVLLVVPYLGRALPSYQFRRDVSDLIAGLRAAHNAAIASNRTVQIVIDVAKMSWHARDGSVHSFGSAVSSLRVSSGGPGAAGRAAIDFMPDGSATPASIDLTRSPNGHTERITVDWISGDVHVEQ